MARILACLALGAWILLLRPFPVTTFLGMCVACASYPLYARLHARLSGRWALPVYVTGLSLAVMLPIALVISLITPQALAGLRTLDRFRESNWWYSPRARAWLASVDDWLRDLPGLEGGLDQLASTAVGLAGTAVHTVLAGGMGLAGGAFQFMFELIIFVMIATLCVCNADAIREASLRLTRFPEAMLQRFVRTIRGAIFAVLVGVVLVAAIQGAFCGIGFAVAGVPQPAFWGLMAAFVAPVPFVGTSLVWGPVCLWLWLKGAPVAAIGLALWGVLAVTGVDNFLRPFFLRTGIDASLVTLVLAILCGLVAFGPVGVLAGPVLVAVGMQAGRESLSRNDPDSPGEAPLSPHDGE